MTSEIYQETQFRRLEDKYYEFVTRTTQFVCKVHSISKTLPNSILGEEGQEDLRREIEEIIQISESLQEVSPMNKVDEIENIQLLQKFLIKHIKTNKPFSFKATAKTINEVFSEVTGLVSDYAQKKDKERESLSEQWKSITNTIQIKHKQLVDTTNSILAETEKEKLKLQSKIEKLRNKIKILSLNNSKEASYDKLSTLMSSSSHSHFEPPKKSKSRTPTPVFAGRNKRKPPRKAPDLKLDFKNTKNEILHAFTQHMNNFADLFECIDQAIDNKMYHFSRIRMQISQKIQVLSYKIAAKNKVNEKYKAKVEILKQNQKESEDLITKLESELSTIKSESESNHYIKNESFSSQLDKYGIGFDEKIEFLQSKIEELSFENKDLTDKTNELQRKCAILEDENALLKQKETDYSEKLRILEQENRSTHEMSNKYKENERIILKIMNVLGVEDKTTLMHHVQDLQSCNKQNDFFSCSSISFHSEEPPEDVEDKTAYVKNLKREIEDLENELKEFRAQRTSFGEIVKTFVLKLPKLNQEHEQIAKMMLKMLGFADEEIEKTIMKI